MAVINGNPQGGQWLPGTGGADTINGYGDGNSLWGGDQNNPSVDTGPNNLNILNGGSHNNLVGDVAVDHFNGGTGTDNIASYQLSSRAVTASLANPSINTGDAAGDTYTNIYELTGTPYGATLYGDNSGHQEQLWGLGGTNYLYAGSGYTVLIGGAGADHMFGGAGGSLADYETANSGVTASLLNSSVNTGEAAGDTYSNVHDLAGSPFGDILYGDDSNNNILGDGGITASKPGGDDTIYAGGGSDTLTGGPGADLLYGGSGTDLFVFSNYDVTSSQVGKFDTIGDYDQGNAGHFDANEYDGVSLSQVSGIQQSGVRIVEDSSNTYAHFQINVSGSWLEFIHMNGLHTGDTVRVVFSDAQPTGVNIAVQGAQNSPSLVDLGSHGASWPVSGVGDFNADKTSDILWRNPTTGQVDQWQMSNGSWSKSIDLGATKDAQWQLVGTGDFNGDGTSDVLWRNVSTSTVDQWQMKNGNWSRSIDLGATKGSQWQAAGIGDFNGDGTSDVLWRNVSTSAVDEWQMKNGNWSQSIDLGATKGSQWTLAGLGDFNGDGTTDVLWRNLQTSAVDEWQMKNGNWAGSIDLGATKGADWTVAGIGDYNGDGTSDILWWNSKSGAIDEWHMGNGNWASSLSYGTLNTTLAPVGIGDFNHDGKSDALWYDSSTGHLNGQLNMS